MAEKIIYLNGSFVPESEAKVSVLDSGFNAGDGVYDVTRTFAHRPFRLRDHTERLFRYLGVTVDETEKRRLRSTASASASKSSRATIWKA